jgi:hypothetical protein
VGNLGSGVLGLAFPGAHRVVVSADAAGYGWYAGASPLSDSAFNSSVTGALKASVGSPAAGRMDLLTTVLHEMGHLVGLDDVADPSGAKLMGDYLTTGARKTENLDAVFAAGF